jgi:phage shock protein PspC (stress-responsive transcriptional regulator)
MKKTVTANIGGLVFHIEEDAYQVLQDYLHRLETALGKSPETEEIIRDIEVRIAELLTGMLQGRQVVTESEAAQVIQTLGDVEDIAGVDPGPAATGGPTQARSQTRRMYRDPDDSILGGVCSGIAAYFGWDPLWVRLGFAGMFLLFGTGIILYIVLWIVIPKAATTAEKLAMRGEPVTAENIKQHLQSVRDDLKAMNTQETRDKVRGLAEQLAEVFGKAIGILFMVIGFILLTVLLYWLIAREMVIHISNNGSFSAGDLMELTLSGWQLPMFHIGVIMVLMGPVINLFTLAVRLLFNIKTRVRVLSITGGVMWTLGMILLTITGISVGRDFAEPHVHKHAIAIEQPTDNRLVVRTAHDDIFSPEYNGNDDHFWELTYRSNGMAYLGWPELEVLPSDDTLYHVTMERSARGRTTAEAIERSEAIRYGISQHGNVLELAPYFSFEEDWMFRNQRVKIKVFVPRNGRILLEESTRRMDMEGHDDEPDDETGFYTIGKELQMGPMGLKPWLATVNEAPADTLKLPVKP